MLAVIAGIIFIILAVVLWIDKTITVQHALAVLCVGLVFIAGHLAFRVWTPAGRW
jgi:hypothetical protein